MYHCQILTHEDAEGGGMMHQFVVTDDQACVTTDVNELNESAEMSLSPNPASQEFILYASYSKESSIRIMDAQGRLMKTQELPAFDESIEIGINGLAAGLDTIVWHTDESISARKLMIH